MADAVKYKFGRNSKRSSKDSSETHAEAPKPKKKKETVAAPTQLCHDGANGSGGKVSSSPSSSQTDAAKTTQPAKKTAQIIIKQGLLKTKDIEMLRYYIQKEYPDGISLQEIERSLTPYAQLTLDHSIWEDIKLKYKDQVPKHPLTTYMLFSKSKTAKVKSNHPLTTQMPGHHESHLQGGKRSP